MAREVKITVVKKGNTNDLYGGKGPFQTAEGLETECILLNVGDEFIVDEECTCPDGFCGWAFADIQRDVAHILFGGSYPWMKDEGVTIACCTDGLRPVFFKVERVD